MPVLCAVFVTAPVPNVPNVEVTARQLDFLARELSSHPQNLSDGTDSSGTFRNGAVA
ncbi:nucleoside triphosphate hydrolase domain [Escherichia coli]|uniref:Nucleoside triphosphate hydrolase domain n=1 Tax=Escherichia coli TaxID=562 RepID=A0A376RLT3_ECOLX|nr:nucleoside triphosphate hydrolase domain [Escherichia coli]